MIHLYSVVRDGARFAIKHVTIWFWNIVYHSFPTCVNIMVTNCQGCSFSTFQSMFLASTRTGRTSSSVKTSSREKCDHTTKIIPIQILNKSYNQEQSKIIQIEMLDKSYNQEQSIEQKYCQESFYMSSVMLCRSQVTEVLSKDSLEMLAKALAKK